MKTNTNSLKKHGLLALVISMVFIARAYPEGGSAFHFQSSPNMSEHQVTIVESIKSQLKHDAELHFLRIDINQLDESNVEFELPGGIGATFAVSTSTRYNLRESTLRGKQPDGRSEFRLFVNEGNVSGQIQYDMQLWHIQPVTGGLHVIYHDSLRLPMECGNNESFPEEHEAKPQEEIEYLEEAYRLGQSSKAAGDDCKIRLLFVYTDAVATAAANSGTNVITQVRSQVQYFNDANTNSNVNFEVEIARILHTDGYVESNTYNGYGRSTDLARFQDINDSYMDVIHDYRDAYQADMCVLLVTQLPGTLMGQAYEIGANYNQAFCVSMWSSPRIVTHEFGHLMGGKHDPYTLTHGAGCQWNGYVASGCSHGHTNVSANNPFYTVMAYNRESSCVGQGLIPIRYWSNPNVSIGGDPTGTSCGSGFLAVNRDNHKKLNEEFATVAAFEPYLVDEYWNYISPPKLENEEVEVNEFADISALNKIEIAENSTTTYEVQSGGEAHFRAGQKIVFFPGFSARSGSMVFATLESCSDIAAKSQANNSAEDDSASSPMAIELHIIPNIVGRQLAVKVTTNRDVAGDLLLFDTKGAIVKEIARSSTFLSGQQSVVADVGGLVPGMYLCSLVTRDEVVVRRFVKQ